VTAAARPIEASPVAASADLLTLARSRSPEDRQRLLLGVVALSEAAGPGAAASPVLSEIFLTLAAQAERDIRLALAERLATAEWAPPALINLLALDEIEIARPIIAASPLLKDQDLLRILVEATLEHQIEVARRPRLSGRVVDFIIDRGEPATVTALASNPTAELGGASLARLIAQAQRIASLRAPLARHPALTASLAERLYELVGDALRQAISERFRLEGAPLRAAMEEAVAAAPGWSAAPLPSRTLDDDEREETERRLVAKLKAAGQLRPGFLVRAVRERRLSLFEHALACLGELPLAQVRVALRAPSPQPLYLACAAVGVDRIVFSALLDDIRALSGGRPGEGPWATVSIGAEEAAAEFRRLMQPRPQAV
jgi:uncharacterized protein (DUF2336 family)